MKTSSIVILVAIAAAIGTLLMYSVNFSTYDTIQSARAKQGRYVHLIARLDRSKPIQYDALKDPNYLSFYAIDSLGATTQVIYHNTEPEEFEHSDRIVLKGQMKGNVFQCDEILMKCPSKYKDDKAQLQKTVSQQ